MKMQLRGMQCTDIRQFDQCYTEIIVIMYDEAQSSWIYEGQVLFN